jgi:hypothetical protein
VRDGRIFIRCSPRDGPRELLCLLWPSSTVFGHAGRWHIAVSRGRSRSGCSRVPPRYFHLSPAGPCSRTPPRRPGSPARSWRFLRARRARRADRTRRTAEAERPAGPDAAGFPARPGGSAQGLARIAARRRSVRPPLPETPAGSPPAPLAGCRSAAAEPPPCVRRLVSEADGSFAGCPADSTGARPLPGLPPSAGRCHPTRRVPPSWFDSHLDGFLRAPAPRLLHLVPAWLRWFPTAPPADRRAGCPAGRPVWSNAGFPAALPSHPSKNPLPTRLRGWDANHGPAAPRRRGRCPHAVFTTSRRCSGPEASAFGRPLPAFHTHIVLPWALFPFEAFAATASAGFAPTSRPVRVPRTIPPLARRLSGRGVAACCRGRPPWGF